MNFFAKAGPRSVALLSGMVMTGAVLASFTGVSGFYGGMPDASYADTAKKDSVQFTAYKDLPLKPTRTFSFTTNEGTWMSLDVSPDGKTILFDLMGDLYTVPISGGKATAITKGLAFDTHPRYSPDGTKILFTSDRSGSENVWIIDMEKKDTIQLTKDRDQNFPAATWSTDGNYVIASRGKLDVKLWMYHKDGGGGVQLIETPNLKTIDPAVSPDGRYIYYSQRTGAWNYNASMPQYSIGEYDRENAKTRSFASRYGSAFTPTLSKDGKWMVYGSRFEDKTGLVLRNLQSGEEKWLAYPVQRDEQESIATMGVLPAMSFTPDSKNLLASYGGKIFRIPIDGSKPVEIPFEANVQLELGPKVNFKYPVSDSSHALATQIRDAVPSPDGKKLAFTVLNRLYVMDLPNGTPKKITNNNFTEAHPSWAPDGNSIVFTTWTPDGGQLYKVNLASKNVITKLTSEAAVYMNPVFSPKGDRIVFTRGTLRSYKESIGPVANGSENKISWIPANGGAITDIDRQGFRDNAHFVKNDDSRIYLNQNGNLLSIRWDGTDEKTHAKITGITTAGISNFKDDEHKHEISARDFCLFTQKAQEAMELQLPSPASVITMSPDGQRALAVVNNDIFVVTIPKTGKIANISVADPNSSTFPARKLTEIGGEFASWSSDSKKVHWSLGNGHFIYDVDKAKSFDDSVKVAKKEEERRKADSLAKAKADTVKVKTDSTKLAVGLAQVKAKSDTLSPKADSLTKIPTEKPAEPKYKPEEFQVKVYFKKDFPNATVLLKGARIITMKGEEVIENGDVLIVNNRIKSIGKSGAFEVPKSAKVVDVTGKTIVPGFVDTHSHMWTQWGLHKNQSWIYATNLAYGVTTTRDPQTATTDVLTYSDMVDAGQMAGPRVYSTGPGVGFWMYNVRDSAHASNILKQYSKYYNTKYIKMYILGPRNVRQWIIKAAKEQGLMPTTEGGLNYKLNMTNMMDGYPGHEHAIPVYPLYKDVINTIAETGMAVTPTLLVSYGGPFAENYYFQTEDPYNDKKMQSFMPYAELAGKTRRVQGWFMPEEHVFGKHAKSMKAMVENGALAGVGSHGEFQGLGYHWELWAIQSGGMKNHDALKVATILGAKSLGLEEDLGSIEQGKLADLVILDKNPLENIRNTNTVKYVMKNGRMYEGDNMNEVYPLQRKLEDSEWKFEKPAVNTAVEN